VIQRSLMSELLTPGALRTALQPIVELRSGLPHIVAYECLTRGPAGSNLENAAVLFDYVRLKHDEPAVDRACVMTALQTMRDRTSTALSLNVHAATFVRDPGFTSFLLATAEECGFAPRSLLIEIVEHAPAWTAEVPRALRELRAAGVRIALDDIGLGQSNLRTILDLRPEVFKIDRYFIHGCHADRDRLAVIASVCHLARAFDAVTVAEGIEDSRDVEPLVDHGITLFQGFLFGAPESPLPAARGEGQGEGLPGGRMVAFT
jgi:EAL domain-containing protein (putative c-di-GMP-specific phosphodiesterase class I)